MRIVFVLTLIFSAFTALSQTDICEEAATGVYWPVKIGIKRHYYAQDGTYVSYFNGDSLKVGPHTYYKEIEEYSSGLTKAVYYREQDGNVFIYDPEKKVEFLELSNNTTPGYVWDKYDKSWRYTVVDTMGTLSTPYCEFKGLLNIRAEPQGKTKQAYDTYYNLLYKRGVGLVGLNIAGEGYSFLGIDKALVEEKSYAASGCEHLESAREREQCTSVQIGEFMGRNMTYAGRMKRGVLALRFLITEKGEVEEVSVAKGLKNADEQTADAIRTLKRMKFIPRQLNGKPYKTWVVIPITF